MFEFLTLVAVTIGDPVLSEALPTLYIKFLVSILFKPVLPDILAPGISIDKLSMSKWSMSPPSIKKISTDFLSELKLLSISTARDFSTALLYCGNAIAASIPIINTTTNNSINVNPFFIS